MTTTLTTSSPSLVNNHHSHNNHHHQSTASINNNNNNNSNNTTTTNTNNTANGDDSCKKYTLVKWLENSQFDVRNEWLGRLHSVPHANIIDYDADELRPGMEISVFHNSGEIWRAQVIVPKTVNSTTLTSIDLQQQQRFNDKLGNNKNGGSGLQLKQELIHHTLDAVPIHHNHHHHHHHLATFVDLTDFNSAGTGSSSSTTTTSLEDMDTDQVHHHQQSSPSKSSHTASSSSSSSGGQLLKNTSTSTPLGNTIMLLTNAPSQGASNSNSSNQNSQNVTIANNLDSNLAKMNKELQFLQTAINEAGLTDLYHSSNAASNAAAATSNGHHHQQQQQQQQQITTLMASTAGDMTNIETILAMQCELLEHQKELKQIEYEQIEQLRQLHSNLNRLAKKFDSFETIVTSVNNGSLKLNKSNLNKLNNSIQHIKILDSELSKDLFGTSVTTGGGIGGTSNLNISGNGGTTWSLCSPQQLAGIIQTTNTNTATATPILQNLTLLNSAATAQPIELTGNGGNYIITSQLVNPGGQKQMNDICFLDPSGTVSNGGQTLKLVGQVDLSSNSASNKPTTLTLLDAAQPQFSELKTVGLLQGADTFLKLNSHTNLNGTANNTTTTTTNNTGLNNENSSTSISEKNKTQGIQTQMALNRFLREAVKQRMGVEFLINNAVSDIPSNVMRQIKKEAFEKYLPNDRRPIKAWGLAMASLRCLKRDLVKNRNKQLANQGGRQQQQPPTNFSNMLTSNAFGLSQVEVVTTTTGGNGGGAENVNSSLDHHITATSSPLAPSKPAGRRGGATIRELELNARRF